MQMRDWFENWGIKGVQLNIGFVKMDWEPQPEEQQAAWELYIELITRIAIQPLAKNTGNEAAALASVYSLFGVTRELLKKNGRKAEKFSMVAVVILNQKIRPFTALWHGRQVAGELTSPEQCQEFRVELAEVQKVLRCYAAMLANIAGVEDFQKLDEGPLVTL